MFIFKISEICHKKWFKIHKPGTKSTKLFFAINIDDMTPIVPKSKKLLIVKVDKTKKAFYKFILKNYCKS